MQRLRASRATTPSRGFITRAASALIFIGATALAFALPGDAAERKLPHPVLFRVARVRLARAR